MRGWWWRTARPEAGLKTGLARTDLGRPGMTGRDLVEQLREHYPDLALNAKLQTG